MYPGYQPAPPDPRQKYSRQELRRNFPVVEEIDVQGNYHPAEVTRKVSRLMTRLGMHITEENTDIRKNPVGQATGETFGWVCANGHRDVVPAGSATFFDKPAFDAAFNLPFIFGIILLLVGVLGMAANSLVLGVLLGGAGGAALLYAIWLWSERFNRFTKTFEFSARVQADFVVAIPGEIYEDFRSGAPNPIRVNLSVIAAMRGGFMQTAPAGFERWLMDPATKITPYPQLAMAQHEMTQTSTNYVHEVIEGLRA